MEQDRPRQNHWVRHNHQNRIPSRWIAFDTEALKQKTPTGEKQTWRMGGAVKWRTDLKGGDCAEFEYFSSPDKLWAWVDDFCRPKQRTVIWAHNLGYDTRIAQLMELLPDLGWHLDWCNMGSQVSTMTWRSDHGTITFADMTSWLPMPLEKIGEMVGLPKLKMPSPSHSVSKWKTYMMRDVDILYRAAKDIIGFVRSEDLGNWQPTGAGMAYATWRHKFLKHDILVHNNEDALKAERKAMHTGRAEAWKHGRLVGDQWTEVDLRQAYVHIARDSELPTKLKWHENSLTLGQYRSLGRWARVLVRAEIRTEVPCVPVYHQGRTIWPTGRFTSWLWDCEFDAALQSGAECSIREAYVYTRAPVLSEWASWVFDVQSRDDAMGSAIVKRWIKHSGRTLIGRLALRTAQWAVWGTNPERETGISYVVDAETGQVNRLMHVGERTMVEEARVEGQDSLPQITGYITAMCRVWLWTAMGVAGFDNIAHVDTDSLLVNAEGVSRLREHYGDRFDDMWQLKGTHNTLTLYGPRNYRGDNGRKVAGIPVKATETSPNKFVGESWASLSGDMMAGNMGAVTVTRQTWTMTTRDPRRRKAGGSHTRTTAIVLDQSSNDSPATSGAPISGS